MKILSVFFLFIFSAQVYAAVISCDERKLEAYYGNPSLFAGKHGKRSLEEVSFVIDCNRNEVYRTFSEHLKTDKELGGKLIVRFTVEPSGVVSNVKAVETSISNQNFVTDILKLVEAMKFVKKDLEPQVIVYPFEFLPN